MRNKFFENFFDIIRHAWQDSVTKQKQQQPEYMTKITAIFYFKKKNSFLNLLFYQI